MKIGSGSCSGTFGELVQGVIEERPFLITLPVKELKSSALFVPDRNATDIVTVWGRQKARMACEKLLKTFGIKIGGYLHIRSNIPIGKGMASSSADIIAAVRAVSDSYSLPVTEELISRIAAEIEPTDGVMYEGVVAYDYLNGQLIEAFASLPPFILIGFDVGGSVDTVEFNQHKKEYSKKHKKKFQQAYELVTEGIRSGNFAYLCEAATISARINQQLLPKPYFDELEQLAQQYNGGVVVAHSGTVIGILLNAQLPNIQAITREIKQKIHFLMGTSILQFS
ncbi:kinase [Ectobacillus funiculus]|uniref:GHMP family kinase ATP-binding protein n=1 Tax=Ectobacillus funiculus TaxID=137993 RepID=UPI00101CA33B|nr:kinase [Ectobacillus funiculus]